jgi:UDP-N-acetylglucosamine 2-epimerase (non-hydrolysing)
VGRTALCGPPRAADVIDMTVKKKIMLVFGTRPEAVKMAPLAQALREVPWCEPVITVTAQHREMLDQVMELFGLTADYDLDMLTPGQTLTDVTTKALAGLGPIMESVKPDAVVVQGDTTTTFAGALAAFYRQIPVVHMEAGLRTDDPFSPFPEEINRRLTTQLSALHLAATPTSAQNLIRDGIKKDHIVITGNTVIDALHWAVERKPSYDSEVLDRIDASDAQVLLVTAHRRESWGEGMRQIGAALREIATRHPALQIVFPIHKNPLVRDAIIPAVDGLANVTVLEPLAYGAFSRLMNRASIVLTDSGGVQEEAPSLGKPVLVMRDTTERPEAVGAGTARLVGTDTARIVDAVHRLLTDPAEYADMANAVNPYGDGLASQRTIDAMGHLFGLCERPSDFAG